MECSLLETPALATGYITRTSVQAEISQKNADARFNHLVHQQDAQIAQTAARPDGIPPCLWAF
jgi:hypothetical protein